MAFDSQQPSAPGAQAAGDMPAPWSQIRRTFCRWGTGGQSFSVNPTPMSVQGAVQANQNVIRMASGSNAEPSWWVASVNAREVIRRAANADDVTSALNPSEVNNNGLLTSKLWCRVGWHKAGTGNVALFDIGPSMRIAVNATNVEMGLVTPPECFSVRGSRAITQSFRGTGTYIDTTIRSSVVPSYGPIRHEALLTQTVSLPADTASLELPQPPGTVAVEIYITGAGAAGLGAFAGRWIEFIDLTGTTPGGGILAQIPFLTIAADRTGSAPRPGNAAGIQLFNPTATDLFPTVVWHLEF